MTQPNPEKRGKMKVRLTVALVVAWLLALLAAPSASADAIECNGKLVDQTSKQVLVSSDKDRQAIESAIKDAESFGADVYVRAFQTTPGGNADAFWAQGFKQCSNWQTPNGQGPKANVVVVMFGMDRTRGIYFNKSGLPALNGSFGNIMSSNMDPNFRGGDFVKGVTSALGSIKSELDPNKPIDKGTDWGPVFMTILWVVLAIVGAVVIFFGGRALFGLWMNVRSEKRERLEAQRLARRAKTDVEAIMTGASFKDVKQMENELLIAVGDSLPESYVAEYHKTLASITKETNKFADQFTTLSFSADGNPDNNLTTSQYEDLRGEYTAMAEGMTRQQNRFDELLSQVGEDKASLSPESLTKFADAIDRTLNQLGPTLDACDALFEVAANRSQLEKLADRLQAVRQGINEKSKAASTHDSLEALEVQVDRLQQEVQALDSSRQEIAGARQLFLSETEKRRRVLNGLEHVDSRGALRELARVEGQIDSTLQSMGAKRSVDQTLKAIDGFVAEIRSAGSDAVKKNQRELDRIEAERRRVREAEAAEERRKAKKKADEEAAARKKRDDEDRARRRRNDDSFSGGFAGGAIGGSLGSSWSSPSSSSGSSSSSDFGGGGGSWGGGGGGSDFGGGGGSW